ncbi:MAG: PKD domain-containing protein, partial [Microthrixaceae bacterium]
MRRFGWFAAVTVAALALLALVLPGAQAQKVFNPGSFVLTPLGGSLKVGKQIFDLTPRPTPECSDGVDNDADNIVDALDPGCAAGSQAGQTKDQDNSELVFGFQQKVDVSLTGTIDAVGNVSIPTNNVKFPPAYVNPGDGTAAIAFIIPTAPGTGTLNPLDGTVNLRLRFKINVTGSPANADLGTNCFIGSDQFPIDLNVLTSGTTTPPAGVTPISGTPYSSTTGQARLVNNTFSVPGAQTCGANFLFWETTNNIINTQLGIPSASGNNFAVIDGKTNPILGKGVVARVVTTPSTPVGDAPFTVGFDASTSTVAKSPATYRWDFPDGSTQSGVSVSKTFNTIGIQTVKLTVTDPDGDSSVALKNVTVQAPPTTTTTTVPTTTTTVPTT